LGSPHHTGEGWRQRPHGASQPDGGWGALGMNQEALSFTASLLIASNWNHRQKTSPEERKTNRVSQRKPESKSYNVTKQETWSKRTTLVVLAYVLEITNNYIPILHHR